LQLLDETVGLSAIRFRRIADRRVLERRYSFEVSIDGNDREAGHLWMIGNTLTALVLPTIELYTPELANTSESKALDQGNVIPFRRSSNDRDRSH
jgi:hypothetical protein